MGIRRSTLAVAAALSLGLPGLFAAVPVAGRTAGSAHPASPFLAASAERVGDGYRLNWEAPAAVGRVRIYTGTTDRPVRKGRPVGSGEARGAATVTGLSTGSRRYFTLVPDHGAPIVIAERGLRLATAPNFRDIGGYRTADGRWVKMGMIYRSDQLDRLSDADLAALGTLGLGLVADLRTQSERAREPDRLPVGARPLVLDVAADSAGTLGGDMRKAQAAIAAGKGAEMLVAANRDFVSLPSARAAYGRLLTELAKAPGTATVYHCTAGKDRTGWATAIILTILGVPRDRVIEDYLLSNRYLKAKNDATIAQLKASGAPIDPAFLEPVLTVRREYIQSAFDEVERHYGSFDAYVRDGLGIDEGQVARLKRLYLAS
jgi:protein-tyrosine phosphatase